MGKNPVHWMDGFFTFQMGKVCLSWMMTKRRCDPEDKAVGQVGVVYTQYVFFLDD